MKLAQPTQHVNEIWKDIPGYEGMYQVSDLGNIRSLDRIDAAGYYREGKARSARKSPSGHLLVNLCKHGKITDFSVHRLVLEAFVGPCPNGMECCHNNGTPYDNRLVNLRWDTRKANSADALKHGALSIGERNKSAKLTESDVRNIREEYATGVFQVVLASKYGVNQPHISRIVRHLCWAWLD